MSSHCRLTLDKGTQTPYFLFFFLVWVFGCCFLLLFAGGVGFLFVCGILFVCLFTWFCFDFCFVFSFFFCKSAVLNLSVTNLPNGDHWK